MKIKCQHSMRHNESYLANTILWKQSLPFYVNPRGILVHRVRSVVTHTNDGKKSHYSVTYWCGNVNCFPIGSDKELLVEYPPRDRLLCAWCEVKATTAGRQKSADKMVGRHVHKGKCVAVRTCCQHLNTN